MVRFSRCSRSMSLWDDLALTWFGPSDTEAPFILMEIKGVESGCEFEHSFPSVCMGSLPYLGFSHSPKTWK